MNIEKYATNTTNSSLSIIRDCILQLYYLNFQLSGSTFALETVQIIPESQSKILKALASEDAKKIYILHSRIQFTIHPSFYFYIQLNKII